MRTEFTHDGNHFWITCLCGVYVGQNGQDTGPPSARGVAMVNVDGRPYEAENLTLAACERTDESARCRWRVGTTDMYLSTHWKVHPETGIVSRRDTIENTGDQTENVTRCLARVALPPGHYECYTQASRWCHENQGAWQPLHVGLKVMHLPGRTTEGATPYLAIRRQGGSSGWAFHILPRGNWTIRARPVPAGGECPFAVVELGLADENLHYTLAAGEALELPEILVQPLPEGQPHEAAPALHRHLLTNRFADAKPEAPVVYNTWFYAFEILDVPRLRKQLAAAREVGCEVFVVDAGWYGPGGTNWGMCVGDWREKTGKGFHGNMREFADEVGAAGLGFGLWIEPERFGPEAPIRAEHPEWFIEVGNMARLDLTQAAAYQWVHNEILRLVETYELAWMKLDFNFALDTDVTGAELSDYYTAWYRMLDEIRSTCPNTFFEGCSSGAMRGDIETLRHVDGHFLSDTVNPTDVLRITQGAWLRLPPGRLTRWAVLRSAGQAVPQYGQRTADSPPGILTPGGALWEPAETVDLNFALLAAMPGMLGFSGNLASLADEQRRRVAETIAFYKRWRRFITGATGHLLTPPLPLDSRQGWIGLQLRAPNQDTSLVFVYRLGNAGAPPAMSPCGLDGKGRYEVRDAMAKPDVQTRTGADLMRDGLPSDLLTLENNTARVFVLTNAQND